MKKTILFPLVFAVSMVRAPAEFTLMHYLKEAGIPYSRLHDVGGWFGGNLYVDIPNLFPDFDADENDPANYLFDATDVKKLYASAVYARGGAGTVYIENANDKGRGWLIVEGCGSAPTPDMVACCIEGKVTGYDTPFKKITIKNCANFVVAKGITLKTDELDIKENGSGKIFANYKDVVTEGYGTIKIPRGLVFLLY